MEQTDIRSQFEWFFGVVEDRNDPLQLGRVRVRAFGYHSDDAVNDLPVKQLPWAQPIQGIDSAAISGIGHSPTGLVEGTWVFGFFADGQDAQRPYIIGSMAGIPTGDAAPGKSGFRDPQGKYPLDDRVGEPDTPRLARSEAEFAPNLINRRKSRLTNVEIAIAPWANSAANTISSSKGAGGSYPYLRETWTEVNPRYDGEGSYANKSSSTYPYNHVYQGESGNIEEYDETPGNTRILQQHASGTFYEIQHSGTKTTKVVNDNYTMIMGNDNITVQGNVNILNQGDVRHEVEGDLYTTVKGDRITKIQGNDVLEVLSDHSTQINGNKNERVAKEKREITDFTFTETVGNNHISTVKKNRRISIFHNLAETITGNTTFISIQNSDFGAGKNMNIGAGVNLNLRAKNGFGTLQTALNFTETIGLNKLHSVANTETATWGRDWHNTASNITTLIGTVKVDINP